METIIYKGSEVQAEVISDTDREQPRDIKEGHWILDTLLRDEAGRYYVRRETHDHENISAPNWAREHAAECNYRCRVHLVSLNTAILWAVKELANGDSRKLYVDASNQLTEGRGVDGPPPFGFDTWAEYRQQLPPAATVATTVTPPDTEEVMESGRRFTFHYPATPKYCGLRVEMILTEEQLGKAVGFAALFGMEVAAFLRAVADYSLPNQPRNFAKEEKLAEQMKAEHIAFARFDEAMQRRLERAAQARGMIVNEFVADAISRDVDCFEENMLVHPQTGELLLNDIDDLYLRINRREVAPPIGYENDPQWRGVFERQELTAPPSLSATRHFADGSMAVTLHLKPEPARLVRTVAELHETSVLAEVYGHMQSCVLGGLARTTADQDEISAIFEDNAPDEEEVAPTVFQLTAPDGRKLSEPFELAANLVSMVEKAARERGTDLGTAVRDLVRGFLYEAQPDALAPYGVNPSTLEAAARYAATAGRTVDEMIVEWLELAATQDPGEHPEATSTTAIQPTPGFADLDDNARELLSRHLTENPNDDPRDVLNGAVDFLLSDQEEDEGAPDSSDEAVRWAKGRRLEQEATGKHHVAFSVWLTDKQLNEGLRANFPVANGGGKSAYFSAFIPMEGSPLLMVDGKRAEKFEQAVQRQRESTHVFLDAEADELVRRYLKVTPWEFTAADIINGCVEKTLSVAFEGMAEAAEHTGLDSTEFHDGAWGYTEEDIVDATLRRTGAAEVQPRKGWSKAQAERVAKAEYENYLRRLSSRQRPRPNPADVALLAAAAPEAVEPALPAEGDEHPPVEEHVDEPGDGTAAQDGKEAQ